jgi:cystathionine gamma-lyase
VTDHRQQLATRVIHAGQAPDPSTGAVMPPIYATSTYAQQSPGVHKGLDYGRSHNPTRWALERCVADLEGGARAFAFASGLAAIATVLELLDHGAHVVAGDDMYGGTYRLFERVRRRSAGHQFSYVDLSDPDALAAALRPETRMVWVESPTNPMLKLADLQAISALCRARGIISVCDNTFASPIVQRPIEAGIDIVVHSTTKFMNGHSDVIGGIAVVGGEPHQAAWCEQLGFLQNSVGAIQGPFDSFLVLRGIKTLALRLERHCANALALAQWLEREPKVARVFYPGLESHPQHALARRQMNGFGKPGRRGKPDRASGPDDARHHPGRAARAARHQRHPDPVVGRGRARGRFAARSGECAGGDLSLLGAGTLSVSGDRLWIPACVRE